MSAKSAVVIGATGLIGSSLTQLLLNDQDFTNVKIISRRPIDLIHPKLSVQLVEFDKLSQNPAWIGTADALFCCVGTTNRKVKGNKQAYRKVDYDIPVNAANIAIQQGISKYLLVSAVGADMHSGNFYLQLKGETESAIREMPFAAVHIFRPSILMGRRGERRIGESIGKILMTLFSPLLMGRLNKLKPISAETVARAMLHAAKTGSQGVFVHHFKEIIKLGNSLP